MLYVFLNDLSKVVSCRMRRSPVIPNLSGAEFLPTLLSWIVTSKFKFRTLLQTKQLTKHYEMATSNDFCTFSRPVQRCSFKMLGDLAKAVLGSLGSNPADCQLSHKVIKWTQFCLKRTNEEGSDFENGNVGTKKWRKRLIIISNFFIPPSDETMLQKEYRYQWPWQI